MEENAVSGTTRPMREKKMKAKRRDASRPGKSERSSVAKRPRTTRLEPASASADTVRRVACPVAGKHRQVGLG